MKGTIVECRTSHESFDLGLASPSWDELELVAPEISGANSVVELFLAEKKLTQVQAKYVNTDSALGSGTGVSVKIEKRLILRFILQDCEIRLSPFMISLSKIV